MTPEQLKKIRKDQGMTQRDFATSVGTSQGMLSNYEKGHWPIPWRVEKKIIEVYNPAPGDIYVPLPVPLPKDYGYIEDDLPRDIHGTPESCKGCRYRATISSMSICDYLHVTGVPRGCLVENCRHYEKGTRIYRKNDWVSGYHIG